MRLTRSTWLVLTLSALAFGQARAEDGGPAPRIGLAAGRGSQQVFPRGGRDYRHEVVGGKLLVSLPLSGRGPFGVELLLEPSLWSASHRLLNAYYVKPTDGPDYLAQRARFTRGETIREYALQVGLLARYQPGQRWSCFVFGSTGPLFGDAETERLARGFAFSNMLGLGLGHRTGRVLLELRPSWRHVSNADTRRPNSGHDTATLELGVSLSL